MKKTLVALSFVLFFSLCCKSQNMITKIATSSSVDQTVNNLVKILESKDLKVFSVIDHQKGAESASLTLLPTTVILFGNPKMGTALMNCDQTAGIDLPMKYLVYKDKEGQTWIAYWKPSLLTSKYEFEECQPVLAKMDGALANFAALAAE